MKAEFIKCENCKAEIPTEICQLAAYKTTIEGKEYLFCCVKCAERYEKKRKEKAKAKK